MTDAVAALRAEIVRIGQLMHEHDFVDGASGNLSARIGPDRILATPSGLAKGFLQPDQLLVLDMQGMPVKPHPAGLKPTSELLMHLEAYRRRPDVNAVIHAHPIVSVALSIAGVSLAECVIPEAVVTLGLVPTTPYATPSSEENQKAISELVVSHDAIILKNHGTLTVGKDLWRAYMKLETLEHTAKTIALAKLLGGSPSLPPQQVEKLLQTRRELGFARPGDEEEFCLACGVCHPPGDHRAPKEWTDSIAHDEAELVKRIAEQVRRQLQSAR
ncbi:MAG: class II aldolase/adducin family protein [Chloroflexi bacterium]|nr:class II aldolase/adducin family protein [Chloroflexota bacterium]